jgi:hypothetical protein
LSLSVKFLRRIRNKLCEEACGFEANKNWLDAIILKSRELDFPKQQFSLRSENMIERKAGR